ncbi:hypothetical protein K488DRAFT_65864 [Vararia minispora EC-137]|uniref:Uncharacterized protein n=1 Tax=Vararia minispora EC-137 TaxID=1314806 RepID=A0ACB8Q4U7_9AGAM|nr:hypothetical protein K488DRAFT_65864 [Vararia minispora EC-137]
MPGGLHDDREPDDGDGSTEILSGLGTGGARRPPKRRGVFEGLAMERSWRAARRERKWMLVFDIASLVLWAAEFCWVVIGDKCPPGAFNGWCNAFNVATAAACILAFVYALSIFFDVKDLHQSSVSPRTRP